MTTQTKLDTFTRAYIERVLWSSTDDNDRPMNDNYSIDDFAPGTLARMIADCERFQAKHAQWLTSEYLDRYRGESSIDEMAGHDFWLTRNGHGAGFWDGDWKAATELTDAAHAY